MIKLTIELSQDPDQPGQWTSNCVELDVISAGRTPQHALEAVAEAVRMTIDWYAMGEGMTGVEAFVAGARAKEKPCYVATDASAAIHCTTGIDTARDVFEEPPSPRAEQAAGREHVEVVVREVVAEELANARRLDDSFLGAIARRVADRLSVPVLSEKDVAAARAIRFELLAYGMSAGTGKHDGRLMDRCVDLLDRLISVSKL